MSTMSEMLVRPACVSMRLLVPSFVGQNSSWLHARGSNLESNLPVAGSMYVDLFKALRHLFRMLTSSSTGDLPVST